jgi:Ca2+-binding RTX toxin-like protein
MIKAGAGDVWTSLDGSLTLTHSSPWRLVMQDGGQIELGEAFASRDFGIRLKDLPQDVTPTREIFGDRAPEDLDLSQPGTQTEPDDLGNVKVTATVEADRVDLLNDSAAADLIDSGGANLLDGGAGSDSLTGAAIAEFFAGGIGNDTLNPGAGADVIAFNWGDGQDLLNPGSGAGKTVSLGGGIRYADLAFRKNLNDLVLETGGTDQITLKNWYASSANHTVGKLQVIAEAMPGYDPNSADALLVKKVQSFDFSALVAAFDAARAADANLTRWNAMDKLLDAHLAGSDDAALGGDLAYRYGLTGSLAAVGTTAAKDILGGAEFGASAQQL